MPAVPSELSHTARDVAADVLALRDARVLVLGDALLDVYVDGHVERISPEAPVPVVHERGRREVLGGAANVAANLAQLGATAILAGRVGADAEGERVRVLSTAQGIDVGAVVTDATVPTSRKVRVLAGYQQVVRVDREELDPVAPATAAALLEHLDAFLATAGPRAVVLADYAKGVLTEALLGEAIARCRAAGVPVVADPKSDDLSRYAGVTILKPNRLEAVRAAGGANAGPEALVAAVLDASRAENVVLSLSADGVIAAGAALDEPMLLRSQVRQVADVSGAGDTMVALLAGCAAAGLPIERGVVLANLAAGRVCEKPGTATLTASELLETFGREHQDRPGKWLADRDVAARIMAAERADGRRVVFTNGCFDILHAGHVRLLQKARSLGDALVVAINTDDSVRRLKGPTRPVNSRDDRVAVLSALGCVDFVCEFEEDTPLELILAVRPDLIVKGGDYAVEDVVGGAEAAAWGGRVEIVPLLEGRSTTRILQTESGLV